MIKFNMEYKVNGRTVPAERFGDELMDAVMDRMVEKAKAHFQRQIEERVAHLRCKPHNQEPRITVTLQHDRITQRFTGIYQVSWCCQEFIDEVAKALSV